MTKPKEAATPLPAEQGALSVNEFCAWASVSPAWAWRLISEGKLKSVKRGRRRLIPMTAAKEWLNGG